ncbi:MAG: DUF4296 domain-containing protein [Bacteroidales bacterium]|nr:DUF4296 domain-containing protein [Bacteroidales bacterium]
MEYRKFFMAVVMSAAFFSSCSGPQPSIKMDEFAQIVYDMHFTDAVLDIARFDDKNLKGDSLSYYNNLFKKYDITRKKFIEEIEWYTQHPDKYKELYEKVMKIVALEEKRAEEEKAAAKVSMSDTLNLWKEKRTWHLPLEGEKEPVAFDIPAQESGVYTLSADAVFYTDDRTENPRMTIIANYEEGTNEQNQFNGIEKDGKRHSIEVQIKTNPGKKLKNLTGWVLDHSTGTEKKHIDLYDITLKYSKE